MKHKISSKGLFVFLIACGTVITVFFIIIYSHKFYIINNAKSQLLKIDTITIYAKEEFDGNEYEESSILGKDGKRYVYRHKIKSLTIDATTVTKLMPKAKYSTSFVLWKGRFAGVAHLKNGRKKELSISYYGGFFTVDGIEGYFYFDGEERDLWERVAFDFTRYPSELIRVE